MRVYLVVVGLGKQEEKRGYVHGTLPHRLLHGGGWRGVRCCMMGVAWFQGLYGTSRGGHEEGLTGVWLGPGMHLWVSCS